MDHFETVVIDGVEKLVTPIDHTGLPYCFAPTVKLPPAGFPPQAINGSVDHGRLADFNHVFPKWEVANSTSPALTETGKAALTGCRVQWVDFAQHHNFYNPRFVGPNHPQTLSKLFGALAMASSGYVPEFAMDLSGKEPRIVGLTQKQRKWLWTSEQVRVYCQSDVSNFLRKYVLSVDLDHIDQRDIEEFIYTFDYDKRLKSGEKLVNQVVERAAEPLEPTYSEVRKQDLLTFVKVGGFKRPPPATARELVKAKLVVGDNPGYVRSIFQQRLAQQPRRSRAEYEAAVA